MLNYNSIDENEYKENTVLSDIGYFLLGLVKGILLLILAIILPPLAVAISGTFKDFITNFLLTLLFFVPGVIHALMTIEVSFKKEI